MPKEFFNVLPPDPALAEVFKHLPAAVQAEVIPTVEALDRVTAGPVPSPSALPAFPRSTMDGYAVRAQDTFGASATLPAYLNVIGEVPMGRAPTLTLSTGAAAIVHTGGMIPDGADAVVMIEHTQATRENEIEVVKAVAVGENVLRVGEDVAEGATVIEGGVRLRPQDLGGLMALGITSVAVAPRPRFGILATGDEVVSPESAGVGPGQIRDINSYSVSGLVERAGGIPVRYGIAPDKFESLLAISSRALSESDGLILSAGSSVSVRDMTGDVINRLGTPGVLVHGVAVKPGKPSLLAVCGGKPVFGLPGNPVSALVIAELFVKPTIERMQGLKTVVRHIRAKLTRNIASEAGREDYVPAKLIDRDGETFAEPVFGKSNLIFTLIRADGIIHIPLNANGLSAGEMVEVRLF